MNVRKIQTGTFLTQKDKNWLDNNNLFCDYCKKFCNSPVLWYCRLYFIAFKNGSDFHFVLSFVVSPVQNQLWMHLVLLRLIHFKNRPHVRRDPSLSVCNDVIKNHGTKHNISKVIPLLQRETNPHCTFIDHRDTCCDFM